LALFFSYIKEGIRSKSIFESKIRGFRGWNFRAFLGAKYDFRGSFSPKKRGGEVILRQVWVI
jgi:hypothetical protein